jgi:predicted nucleic acid-binding protein
VLDRDDAHHEGAHAALDEALARNDTLALPASAFAETLVGPSRRGPEAVAVVQELIDRLPIDVVPLDVDTARAAARLRSEHRALKLPDALVIATAITSDADLLLTTDRRWPSRRRLQLRAEVRCI